jgi:hypothetical protein
MALRSSFFLNLAFFLSILGVSRYFERSRNHYEKAREHFHKYGDPDNCFTFTGNSSIYPAPRAFYFTYVSFFFFFFFFYLIKQLASVTYVPLTIVSLNSSRTRALLKITCIFNIFGRGISG